MNKTISQNVELKITELPYEIGEQIDFGNQPLKSESTLKSIL